MTLKNNDKNEAMSPIPCEEKPESWWDFIKEIIRFTILSLVVVLPIRFFVAQPFLVDGASMVPTFEDGQYLIVDEISYYFNSPQRYDVIVFRYPLLPSKYFIKRIIGLPGETVIVRDNTITIKNSENSEGITLEEVYVKNPDFQSRNKEWKLSDSEYFVMGDNRAGSSDSREWGPLDKKFITGHVFVRLLPLSKAAIYPEKVTE
ncbi:MAG TPA: signal peptidase I [Candidatus Paceibacterota bacterium]|nr:signal peptidase I [Candidatus Paceibacterota bacterium]